MGQRGHDDERTVDFRRNRWAYRVLLCVAGSCLIFGLALLGADSNPRRRRVARSSKTLLGYAIGVTLIGCGVAAGHLAGGVYRCPECGEKLASTPLGRGLRLRIDFFIEECPRCGLRLG